MRKKIRLTNLNQNEIKKTQQKEILAGQQDGAQSGRNFTYNGGGQLGAVAPVCSAWCECTCYVGNVYDTMDNIGIGNAKQNYSIS